MYILQQNKQNLAKAAFTSFKAEKSVTLDHGNNQAQRLPVVNFSPFLVPIRSGC